MNVMTLSAALSFGRLLTDAYSLQNRLAMVVIVDACSLPSEAITEEECACVVLPSTAPMTLKIAAGLNSLQLSVMNSCQRRALASSIVSWDAN